MSLYISLFYSWHIDQEYAIYLFDLLKIKPLLTDKTSFFLSLKLLHLAITKIILRVIITPAITTYNKPNLDTAFKST